MKYETSKAGHEEVLQGDRISPFGIPNTDYVEKSQLLQTFPRRFGNTSYSTSYSYETRSAITDDIRRFCSTDRLTTLLENIAFYSPRPCSSIRQSGEI